MTLTAIVVLTGTKEFKQLDTKSGGQLTRACAELEDNDGVTIVSPNKIDAQYVRVENRTLKDAVSARNFGGSVYSLFKDKADTLKFNISHKFNADIKEGTTLAGYQFLKYKSDAEPNRLKEVIIDAKDGGIAASINLARDFITEPGNKLYPAVYAEQINATLSPLGVTVKAYHQSQLEAMGFNLLLSVGQGSARDSYVVVMEWLKAGEDSPTVALVGKGVTFDSGGISLKPGKGMGDMKYDMAGSAAVVGAMHAIATHKLDRNVIGIVGLVENMPDGTSIKPGDVVTSLSGRTVENLNTDAEGRLVLADILTHVQTYEPEVVIDLATLTGAILVSLGHEMAGLFTNSSDLEQAIIDAGKNSGEKFWRMPMGKVWSEMLDSDIADMQNIGGAYGGSTTAAEFLYRFIDSGRVWAHLDIAGMAWEESGKAITPKGAAGFGIRTLFNFVKNADVNELTIDDDMDY